MISFDCWLDKTRHLKQATWPVHLSKPLLCNNDIKGLPPAAAAAGKTLNVNYRQWSLRDRNSWVPRDGWLRCSVRVWALIQRFLLFRCRNIQPGEMKSDVVHCWHTTTSISTRIYCWSNTCMSVGGGRKWKPTGSDKLHIETTPTRGVWKTSLTF